MKKLLAAAALGCFALCAGAAPEAQPAAAQPAAQPAAAQPQAAAPLTAEQASKRLQEFLDTPVQKIRKAPFCGFWEILIGDRLFYADPSASYLFFGDIFDMQAKLNITDERRLQLTAEQIAALPFENAIKTVHGNGKRRLVVFSDSNCTYCKLLETSLESIDNVTIYTFLVPALGPDSARGERDIWCSKDQAKAWADWMVRGIAPKKATADCVSKVLEENARIAARLGLTGTPVLFFANGMKAPGNIPKSQIEAMLAVAAAK